jgi:hypothetical protein
MSLLSSFVTKELITALEAEFVKHEPELQTAFVDEVTAAVNSVVSWVNSKIALRQPVEAPNEKR